MEVTLKQFKGRGRVREKEVMVSHPVDNVYVDGVQVGQMAHIPDAGVVFNVPLPRQRQEEITKKCCEIRKGGPWEGSGRFAGPPTEGQIYEAIEVIAEIEGHASEEEDDETEE